MQQHDEKGTQTNAQVKHERNQPGVGKVGRIEADTDQSQNRTHDEQSQRNLARPFWEL